VTAGVRLAAAVGLYVFLIASLIVGPRVWSAHLELLPLLLPPALAVLLGCTVINTVGRPQIRRYSITEFNLVSES
jgi:hypothetical protein